jgi:hypothetical protein
VNFEQIEVIFKSFKEFIRKLNGLYKLDVGDFWWSLALLSTPGARISAYPNARSH